MSQRGIVLFLTLASSTCAINGCGSSQPAANGPKGLFDQHCARCHAQAGEPGGPKIGSSKGPSLAKIGAEPGRTANYIPDSIRDSKSKNADPKMPAIKDVLKEDEILSLAEYLRR